MIYPEGLMHRKVNVFLALLIILIIAGFFAFVIAARAQFFNPFAGASIPGVGVTIFTPPIKCVLNPTTGTCPNCPICGDLGGICASLNEIGAEFISGTNMLYKGLAFCTPIQFPTAGGTFTPGAQCLGNVLGIGPHWLMNFGCSTPGGFF